MARKIMLVTGSRGEWGYIRPILQLIDSHRDLDYLIVATNMHLLLEFGSTYKEIENDGFHVDEKIYMALDGYTTGTMTKSLGVFMMSMADLLDRHRPDFILLAGDRGEQLVSAIAGAHAYIPVAHIQAGEVSGNIDGLSRHAIARFTHIHFAANRDAADRLRKTGEQAFRIFQVGAPQLDDFLSGAFESRDEVMRRFQLDPDKPVVLMAQHPVTEQMQEAGRQMQLTLEALSDLRAQTVLVYPNNDAGSSLLRSQIDSFRGPWLRVERSVPRSYYAGLMRVADVMVGNSSSGLLEAPSFELPAVNIGRRQEGRVQGRNVINCAHNKDDILASLKKAMSPEFKAGLEWMENPYGDGHASQRIVDTLADIEIDERLIYKALTY